MDSVKSFLVPLAVVVAVMMGLFFAYQSGKLDPLIEAVTVYLLKGKAMAEKKKLQAQGQKAGVDFMDCKPFPSWIKILSIPWESV